ncbi:hypothetical protein ACFL4L_07495, partial [bacterium]
MPTSNEYKMIRFFYSLSLGLSLLLTIPSMFQDIFTYVILFLFISMILLAGLWLLRWMEKYQKSASLFVTIAMLNLLFISPELILRDIKFRYESGIQFGHPRPTHFIHFITDDQLFWRLNPENNNVNSFGFPGKEIQIPKPDNTVRLLYLGDSCTQQGY